MDEEHSFITLLYTISHPSPPYLSLRSSPNPFSRFASLIAALDESVGTESTLDGDGVDEEDSEIVAQEKQTAAAMSKMPKPVLAEANMLMKRLDDDEQSFMKRALLIGVERNFAGADSVGNSASEFESLATGNSYSYLVRQVASAGMRDGSVTLPLGSVDVEVGMKIRFFVRDSMGAKEELGALWTGYKKKALEAAIVMEEGESR